MRKYEGRTVGLYTKVSPEEKEVIDRKMALLGTMNLRAYLRKMAVDGYVVQLDMSSVVAAQHGKGGRLRRRGLAALQIRFVLTILGLFHRLCPGLFQLPVELGQAGGLLRQLIFLGKWPLRFFPGVHQLLFEPPALTVLSGDKPSIRAALRSYVPPAPVAAGAERDQRREAAL